MKTQEEAVQLNVTLTLPRRIAREVEAGGLLQPERLAELLTEELRCGTVDRLFRTTDRIADVAEPALTQDEIEAEIQAARQVRHGAHAGSR